jgi:hypothetical protein
MGVDSRGRGGSRGQTGVNASVEGVAAVFLAKPDHGSQRRCLPLEILDSSLKLLDRGGLNPFGININTIREVSTSWVYQKSVDSRSFEIQYTARQLRSAAGLMLHWRTSADACSRRLFLRAANSPAACA